MSYASDVGALRMTARIVASVGAWPPGRRSIRGTCVAAARQRWRMPCRTVSSTFGRGKSSGPLSAGSTGQWSSDDTGSTP